MVRWPLRRQRRPPGDRGDPPQARRGAGAVPLRGAGGPAPDDQSRSRRRRGLRGDLRAAGSRVAGARRERSARRRGRAGDPGRQRRGAIVGADHDRARWRGPGRRHLERRGRAALDRAALVAPATRRLSIPAPPSRRSAARAAAAFSAHAAEALASFGFADAIGGTVTLEVHPDGGGGLAVTSPFPDRVWQALATTRVADDLERVTRGVGGGPRGSARVTIALDGDGFVPGRRASACRPCRPAARSPAPGRRRTPRRAPCRAPGSAPRPQYCR